jgi:hypothetical protein
MSIDSILAERLAVIAHHSDGLDVGLGDETSDLAQYSPQIAGIYSPQTLVTYVTVPYLLHNRCADRFTF